MAARKKAPHENRAHSALGASSAERWMNCPGSIRLIRQVPPQPSSTYADEGTAAHQVCEKALIAGVDAVEYAGTTERVREEEFSVDDEMVDAVQVYLDTIRADIEPGDVLMVEKKFDLGFIKDGMFGTNDASVYKPAARRLIVYDFKYGRGYAVSAENNSQLKYYGLGSAYEVRSPVDTVELVIVQPRAGGVRRWSLPFEDLFAWSGELLNAAEATEDPEAHLSAGSWCKWCPAAAVCPEIHKQALETAKRDFEDVPVPAETLSLEDLARVLDRLAMFKAWANSVEAYALRQAEGGYEIPGYKLTPKRAMRNWVDADKAAETLSSEYSVTDEELYTRKIKTPAQIEKLLGKPAFAGLSDHVEKKSTGNNLVPISDPSPTALPSAKSDFESVTFDDE